MPDKDQERETFYRLAIDDYSAPSASSGLSCVFGSMREVEDFLEANEERERGTALKMMEACEDVFADALAELGKAGTDETKLLKARERLSSTSERYHRYSSAYLWGNGLYASLWRKYLGGMADVPASEMYARRPRFVEQCSVIGEKEIELGCGQREIENIYGCGYEMSWARAKASVRWVSFVENTPDGSLHDRSPMFARCVLYDLADPDVGGMFSHFDDEGSFWGAPGLLEYNAAEGWLRSRVYLQDRHFETVDEAIVDMMRFTAPDFQPLLFAVVGDG